MKKIEQDTYGLRLKSLRKAKGWLQEELAKKSGIAVGTIRNHEQDRGNMTADHLFAYSDALGLACEAFKGCVPAKKDSRTPPGKKPKRKGRK